MKILFIVTQSEFGGAQRFVFEAAKYFAGQGNEIIVAYGEGDGEISSKFKVQSEKLQVKTQNLRHLKRQPGLLTAIFSIKEIVYLLKSERPDVLFLCSTTAGIIGSIAAFLYKLQITRLRPASGQGFGGQANYKLQVVYRIGGWAFRDPRPWWQNRIILLLEKLTSRFKDKIIVNCEIDKTLAIKHKIAPAEKVVKIYNGVEANELVFLPKEEAQNYLLKGNVPNGRIVGCVANFYKTKGLKYLVEAARLNNLNSKIENLKYIVIGDGRERKKLDGLIKKYGLEETVFLVGRVPDAYRYLKGFDLFVLASLKEGFPWIILEAMAAGVPVVATGVGAVPEIIENQKEGLLVEPKNAAALSEKIAWLLEHQTEAQKMAILARKKLSQEFTRQKMLSKLSRTVLDNF